MNLRIARAMNLRIARAAGGLLLVGVGIWAGFRVHGTLNGVASPGTRTAATTAAMRVPAGAASPASPSDLEFSGPSSDPEPGLAQTPQIPERLPDFSLADPTGKDTSVRTWRGKSLLINFWATWCTPCRHEIPLLQALDREWRPRGVQVLGIAVDHADRVQAYAADRKIDYPVLVGEQEALDVAAALGVTSPALPFSVFTDQQGRIVALFVGELHRPQADLILAKILEVNRGSLGLTEAQRSIRSALQALRGPDRG